MLLAAHVKIFGQLKNEKGDRENVPRCLSEVNGCFGNLTLSLPTILFDAVSSQDHFPEKVRQTQKLPILVTVLHVSIRKHLEFKQDVN